MVDNQHKKIIGYGELSEAEIKLMNQLKELAAQVGHLVAEVLAAAGTPEGKRWGAIAKTQLQQGFMALTRAVALPETF